MRARHCRRRSHRRLRRGNKNEEKEKSRRMIKGGKERESWVGGFTSLQYSPGVLIIGGVFCLSLRGRKNPEEEGGMIYISSHFRRMIELPYLSVFFFSLFLFLFLFFLFILFIGFRLRLERNLGYDDDGSTLTLRSLFPVIFVLLGILIYCLCFQSRSSIFVIVVMAAFTVLLPYLLTCLIHSETQAKYSHSICANQSQYKK